MRPLPLAPAMALVALGSSAFVTCARQENPGNTSASTIRAATLVVSAAVVGHLEPCGCSPDQRGGLARAAGVVERIRAEGKPVLVIDAGDRFVADAAPADPVAAQQRVLEASTMAEVTRLMKYDALVLGDRDAAFAGDLLQTEALPPLVDTGETARPGTKAGLVLDAGGLRIGLTAVGRGPEAASTLAARTASLRAQGVDAVVLVAYRTLEGARELLPAAKEAGVDLVIAARAEVPEVSGNAGLFETVPPLFQVAARGEALLRVDLVAGGQRGAPFVRVSGAAERDEALEAMRQRMVNLQAEVTAASPSDPLRELKTKKVLEIEERRARLASAAPPALPEGRNAFTSAFVPMTPGLEESKPVRAALDRFDARVADENLVAARAHPKECPAAKPKEASYVGDRRCVECHEEAEAFWRTTSHAHAYETLEKKRKQYNVQCVGCHVLAWERPGGACSIAETAGRQNVQCESCHGPGSLHAQDGEPATIARKVPEATCKTCHDPPNSPHFNDATYRPQILGPGHGAPLKPAGAPLPAKRHP
jgi:hypothetical protein